MRHGNPFGQLESLFIFITSILDTFNQKSLSEQTELLISEYDTVLHNCDNLLTDLKKENIHLHNCLDDINNDLEYKDDIIKIQNRESVKLLDNAKTD